MHMLVTDMNQDVLDVIEDMIEKKKKKKEKK